MTSKTARDKRIAVIGGGIQGICAALALAERGCAVDLFEEHGSLVTEASLWNEGKIHLGFVFANDPTLKSAAAMIEGSLSFAPLINRWCGVDLSRARLSTPFQYAVHRQTMRDAEAIRSHFAGVQEIFDSYGETERRGYFGFSGSRLFGALAQADLEAHYDPRTVVAAFQTEELSIDPRGVADILVAAIDAHPRIALHLGQRVESCQQVDTRPALSLAGGEGKPLAYDEVINATWRDRLRIDETYGLERPARPWLYRYKMALHSIDAKGASMRPLPSTTIVLGPFGDLVNFGGGRYYFSWYPTGCIASSSALCPPDPSLDLDDAARAKLRTEIIERLARILPGVTDIDLDAATVHLGGGQIFAWGSSDIDHPDSQLHQRFAIGSHSHGHYHSVDTGKYCMAPYFAERLAQRIA